MFESYIGSFCQGALRKMLARKRQILQLMKGNLLPEDEEDRKSLWRNPVDAADDKRSSDPPADHKFSSRTKSSQKSNSRRAGNASNNDNDAMEVAGSSESRDTQPLMIAESKYDLPAASDKKSTGKDSRTKTKKSSVKDLTALLAVAPDLSASANKQKLEAIPTDSTTRSKRKR